MDTPTLMRRASLLFILLAVVATWPQALRLDAIPDNVDAFFSLWRLGWIAHQLPADPWHLFDGNIFYPEKNTLAYSDAVLLQGAIALPFIRAGMPIVVVYNVLVLASFVACGLGMALLVHRLTGATLPAILAGLVFAFTPFRFDHYYHLELLWAQWMPLCLWMLHRTLESGRLADGLGVGAMLALQFLSSIYYGVFLSTGLVVVVAILLPGYPPGRRRRPAIALASGAVLAAAIVLPYALPYVRVSGTLGERNSAEALLYAAGPRHYLAAMPENLLEGWLLGPLGRPEKRLFPGFVALALSLVALWPPISRRTLAYGVLLVVAANLSFGPRGLGYEWLRDYAIVYRGLRAPARAGEVALLAVGVLAAMGCVRLRAWLASLVRRPDLVVALVVTVAFAEYLVAPLALAAVPRTTPAAYLWLRVQPPGVLAELPMPVRANLPFHEGEFQFLSTFHWRPLVNGYSGNWTRRYVSLLDRVSGFPDDSAIEALKAAGVTDMLVHERFIGREPYRAAIAALGRRDDLQHVGRFDDGGYEIAAFRVGRH
jgi:hypothetical protein